MFDSSSGGAPRAEADPSGQVGGARRRLPDQAFDGMRMIAGALAAMVTARGQSGVEDIFPYLASRAQLVPGGCAFEVRLPNGPVRKVGVGLPSFRLVVRNEGGLAALRSFDELKLCEAYMANDLDIEGDFLSVWSLRSRFADFHPLARLWSTFAEPALLGQTRGDKQWIAEHYDFDADFYLLFLDRQARCYSHGYFEQDDETLETAVQRKLDTAFAGARIGPGARVLDIGAGWGAFTQHAGRRGARVTSLTISEASERYVKELIAREGLDCEVLLEHFLEHRTVQPYDAIVNLGVSEHLPDYEATLAQYRRLLRPGGRVFVDACSSRQKFPFRTFMQKYIWSGNHSPLHLSEYLREIERTPFELVSLHNDRMSYYLTARHWAQRLDQHHHEIAARWGEHLYRRFRLYLWGCANSFRHDDAGACHLILELPRHDRRTLAAPNQRLPPVRDLLALAGRASRDQLNRLGLGGGPRQAR